MLLQKNSAGVNKNVIGHIFRKAFTHIVIIGYVILLTHPIYVVKK